MGFEELSYFQNYPGETLAVKVLTYEKLYEYATKKYGEDQINQIFSDILKDKGDLVTVTNRSFS